MGKMKTYSLSEMEDKHIGKKGTKERDEYEYELRMDLLGQMIRTTRKEKNLTQEKLGKLIGVNKSQISKLENNAKGATMETIIRVFKALKAEINFNVILDNTKLEIA
jgi:DNA-binding XRE family transcriptional regulator